MARDEKLLLAASALVVLVALASPGWWTLLRSDPSVAGLQAVFALLIPVHLVWRRLAPGESATWFGLAGAAGLAASAALALMTRGPRIAFEPPPGTGFAGALALTSILAIPGFHFARAARHPYAPLCRAGRAGLVFVTGYAAAGLAAGAFTKIGPTALYLVVTSLLYLQIRQREREHYATPVERRQTLSVTIIVKNEGDRLARCLDSVNGWADEIVVLDSGSTDDSVAIARRYTDRIWITDWPGYGPQKQRALERATGNWVLSIDADEELTPELRHDIDRVLDAHPACVGWRLPWGVIVHGQLLDFGRSARAPLRLFRREGSRFTNAQVHETILLPQGKVGQLAGRLLHHTHRDFGHALDKVARYGWLGAQQRFAAGRRGGGLAGATLRAAIVFVQVYFVRLGLLDGAAGFLTAALYGQVAFDKYAGLWALHRENEKARRS